MLPEALRHYVASYYADRLSTPAVDTAPFLLRNSCGERPSKSARHAGARFAVVTRGARLGNPGGWRRAAVSAIRVARASYCSQGCHPTLSGVPGLSTQRCCGARGQRTRSAPFPISISLRGPGEAAAIRTTSKCSHSERLLEGATTPRGHERYVVVRLCVCVLLRVVG